VGAQTDVLATSLGPYAKTFLHIGNRTAQIRGPVDEMVDQHSPIIPRDGAPFTDGGVADLARLAAGRRDNRGTARAGSGRPWHAR